MDGGETERRRVGRERERGREGEREGGGRKKGGKWRQKRERETSFARIPPIFPNEGMLIPYLSSSFFMALISSSACTHTHTHTEISRSDVTHDGHTIRRVNSTYT